jgi:hypothetical protein
MAVVRQIEKQTFNVALKGCALLQQSRSNVLLASLSSLKWLTCNLPLVILSKIEEVLC